MHGDHVFVISMYDWFFIHAFTSNLSIDIVIRSGKQMTSSSVNGLGNAYKTDATADCSVDEKDLKSIYMIFCISLTSMRENIS